MSGTVHALMDAFALASAALDESGSVLLHDAASTDDTLFNVFVIEETGVRTLVRENLTACLSGALVSSANHGAKVQGLARTYQAVPVEAIN